jgi:hypothetical protein
MLRQSNISMTMIKRPNSPWADWAGVTGYVGVVGHAWYCLPYKNDTVFDIRYDVGFPLGYGFLD